MKSFVEYVVRSLVDEPGAVHVVQREAGRATVLEVSVAPEDTGKIIGKDGRVAKALRVLLRVAANRQGRRAILSIS